MFPIRKSHSLTAHKVDSGIFVTPEMTKDNLIFWPARKTSSSHSLIFVWFFLPEALPLGIERLTFDLANKHFMYSTNIYLEPVICIHYTESLF